MANSKNLLKLYLIGMLATVIGFCCPMFSLLGTKSNGFNFINFNNSGFLSVGAILIFFGALAGIVFSLISIKSLGIVKLLAVIATVIGLIFFIIGIKRNPLMFIAGVFTGSFIKTIFETALIGFYLVVAGIILAAVGYATNK